VNYLELNVNIMVFFSICTLIMQTLGAVLASDIIACITYCPIEIHNLSSATSSCYSVHQMTGSISLVVMKITATVAFHSTRRPLNLIYRILYVIVLMSVMFSLA